MIAEPQWTPLGAPPGIVPESARWYAAGGFFQWTDIRRQTVSRWHPGDERIATIEVDDLACAAIPSVDGGTILVGRSTVSRLDFDSGAREVIHDFGLEDDMRLNDAAADPQGRLWVGSRAAERNLLRGTLYRLDRNGSVHEELHNVLLSNGISWTAEGDVAYYADFRANRVDRLTFDSGGHVRERDTFAQFDAEQPDGLTVDAEGRVWITAWEDLLCAFAPSGAEVLRWASPAPRPTSVAFGGDDLATMMVTTARGRAGGQGADDEPSPLAGRVFVSQPGVHGIEPFLVDI